MKRPLIQRIAAAALLAAAGCASEEPVAEYNQPLTSPGAKFTKLPPAVQNSVRAEAGMAEITDIFTSTNFGPTIYEVYFRNADLFPPLFVASDGSVLTSNLQVAVGASEDTILAATGAAASGLKLGDLPPAAARTVQQKAPTAEVRHITRITQGNKVFYEVTFKDDTRHPTLLIDEEGNVVSAVPDAR